MGDAFHRKYIEWVQDFWRSGKLIKEGGGGGRREKEQNQNELNSETEQLDL